MFTITVGFEHTIILCGDRERLIVCGQNSSGQLGLGIRHDLQYPDFREVTAGWFALSEFSLTDLAILNRIASRIKQDSTNSLLISRVEKIIGISEARPHNYSGILFSCDETSFIKDIISANAPELSVKIQAALEVPFFNHGECVAQIVAGAFCTLILTSDGRLLVSGSNKQGQLGLGIADQQIWEFTHINVLQPPLQYREKITLIAASSYSSFIVISDEAFNQRLLACGANYFGQLGLGDTDDRNLFTHVTNLPLFLGERIEQIVGNNCNSFILTSRGAQCKRILQSGSGSNQFQPIALPLAVNETIEQMAVGFEHILLLTSDHRLLVSGSNNVGQVGLGNINAEPLFKEVTNLSLLPRESIKQIAAYGSHSFIVTSKGLLACGDNRFGQLGLGERFSFFQFTRVILPAGTEEIIETIVAGGTHNIILLKGGQLLTAGVRFMDQLGPGRRADAQQSRFSFLYIIHPAQVTDLPWGAEVSAVAQADVPCLATPSEATACALGSTKRRKLSLTDDSFSARNDYLPVPVEVMHIIFSYLTVAELGQLAISAKMLSEVVYGYQVLGFRLSADEQNTPVLWGNILAKANNIFERLSPHHRAIFRRRFKICFPADLHRDFRLQQLLPVSTDKLVEHRRVQLSATLAVFFGKLKTLGLQKDCLPAVNSLLSSLLNKKISAKDCLDQIAALLKCALPKDLVEKVEVELAKSLL